MPIEKVVVNASPLITLFKSQLVDLLPQLFGQVQVPPAVWLEVTASKDDIAAQMLPYSSWATQTEEIAIHPLVRLGIWVLGSLRFSVMLYGIQTILP
jgi:predicted nucleic acid-binding protein